jgi:hypothetical protein
MTTQARQRQIIKGTEQKHDPDELRYLVAWRITVLSARLTTRVTATDY